MLSPKKILFISEVTKKSQIYWAAGNRRQEADTCLLPPASCLLKLSHFSFTMHVSSGWCPESECPESLNTFLSSAPVGNYPWDDTDKPPVVRWADFAPMVAERAAYRDRQRQAGICDWPWIVAQRFGVAWADPNQGSLGTCAGFAADTASWCMLLQHLADGIELEFVPTNPYPAWILGREDARYRGGGASLSMVLNGINRYGRFPVAKVGTYAESIRSRTDWRKRTSDAEPFQAGCCYLGHLSTRDMVAAILLCVRAGHPVAFGNSVAVSNTPVYLNGVKTGTLRGGWSHATAFVAYREIGGRPYLALMNSWGKVYGTGKTESDPASVIWMSEENVRRMCEGRYRDAFTITYVESTPGVVNWRLVS